MLEIRFVLMTTILNKIPTLVLLLLILLVPVKLVEAQEERPDYPVYVVQAGDNMSAIASRFGVTLADLARVNGISNVNLVNVGDELRIPGLSGIQGRLVTQVIDYGETLRSLSRMHQVPVEVLSYLNHITSPIELYAGSNLIVLEVEETGLNGQRASLKPGQSLLEMAILHGTDVWTLANMNYLQGTWEALPGDVLRLPGPGGDGPGSLPGAITQIEVSPLPFVQGKTSLIKLQAEQPLTIEGEWMDGPLNFFRHQDGSYIALQGVHAMLETGAYPLTIAGQLEDGTPFGFSQLVQVNAGGYVYEEIPGVDPITLDPSVSRPEDEQWKALVEPVTVERLWDGVFEFPSPPHFYGCWPSMFGSRRSYNQSGYFYFHTGLDVCGQVGDDVFAPAMGQVVFTGEMTVRGNAIMINHGWGIYSGYMHLSDILVNIGDWVEPGQLIGKVGATGRVTGPHLHWEIWAGGVQVDPFDWLAQEYP
jgi:murein DD-endopeptidase MepM/ murein hydrolase activator NlpD